MKRDCKNIDITDWKTDYPWVYDCIQRHKRRHDFRTLICRIGGMSKNDYYRALETNNKKVFEKPAENIAREAARRIVEKSLNMRPVEIREKVDRSSGKVRLIGKESAMQQVFDYIAKESTNEIWNRRIVSQQASSIIGRGQVYGTRIIKRWIDKDNRAARWANSHNRKYSRRCKYFVKLDIAKCYQSMRLEMFMKRFQRDCGNETILWLWKVLLSSHRVDGYEGFMIGALPSQWACQYIVSFLYRYIMDLYKERRNRRTKLVAHTLIYMDDILLTGTSRRDLKVAVRKVIKYAKDEFALTIKPNWHIQELEKTPIDMMGYVLHRDGSITIRPRIFLRARRAALRANRKKLTVKSAKRLCSYKGYFHNSNSQRIKKKLKLDNVFREASRIISRNERRNHDNLQPKTRADPIHAPSKRESRRLVEKEYHPGNDQRRNRRRKHRMDSR